jgi:RHS repeat-associated protein
MSTVTQPIARCRNRPTLLWLVIALIAAGLAACSNEAPTPEPPESNVVGGVGMKNAEPSGAYRQRVAITVPQYYGIAPTLSMEYSSQGFNGPLGAGWALQGTSTVLRGSPGRGTPSYTAKDRFYLDGMELVRCASGMQSPSCTHPVGAGLTAYAPRSEDYRRYAFDPAGAPGGIWIVWAKDGTRYIYRPRVDDGSHLYAWDLTSVHDTVGHQVNYAYTRGSAQATAVPETYLRQISYGATKITFYYELRPDPVNYGNGYGLVVGNERLRAVDVTMDSSRVRVYQLSYIKHQVTARSFLHEVREYGTDAQLDAAGTITNAGSIMSSPTTFDAEPGSSDPWDMFDKTVGGGLPQDGGSPLTVVNGVAFTVPAPPFLRAQPSNLGDIDGDGRTDWAQASYDLVSPATDPTWHHTQVLFTTVLAGRGAPAFTQTTLKWPFGYALIKTTLMGDVDGDGRSDLIFVLLREEIPGQVNLGGAYIGFAVALSTGDGQFDWARGTVDSTSWETREGSTNRVSHCLTGDTNGDGRTDVLCSFTRGNESHYVGTARSVGNGTFGVDEQPAPFEAQGETRLLAVGDSNGDGLADPMFLDYHRCPPTDPGCEVHYELVTGIASGGAGYEFEPPQDTKWPLGSPTFFASDINGDGKDDYVVFKSITGPGQSGEIETAMRSPDGTFSLHEQTVPATLNAVLNSVSVGDANGDGQSDLLVISRQSPGQAGCATNIPTVHVNLHRVLSLGTGGFDLPSSWENCEHSKELAIKWDDVGYAPVEPQAADLDGDGTADFLIAVLPNGQNVTTLREDLSGPPTADPYNWRPVERNGDGREDWIYLRNTPTGPLVTSLIATDQGYTTKGYSPRPGTAHFTVSRRWHIADVNADGKDDLTYLDYRTTGSVAAPVQEIQVGTWLSTSGSDEWEYKPSSVFVGLSERHRNTLNWRVVDINGDGRSDLTSIDRDENTGSLATWTLLSKGDGTWTQSHHQLAGMTPDQWNWRPADANRDGKTDLVHLTVTDTEIRLHTFLSNGDGSWTPASASPTSWPRAANDKLSLTDSASWHVGDVNQDGSSDLFHISPTGRTPTQSFSLHTVILFAHGDGSGTRDDDDPAGSLTGDMRQWRVGNLGSDHSPDLLHVHVAGPTVTVTTLSYTGDSWTLSTPDSNASPASQNATGNRFTVADLDGDGRDDLARFDLTSGGMTVVGVRSLHDRDVLTKTTISTGGTISMQYGAAGRAVAPTSTTACHLPVGARILTVSAIMVDPGLGFNKGRAAFDYDCPVWSYEHRGLLGWRNIYNHRQATATQPAGTIKTVFDLTDQCPVRTAHVAVYDGSGTPLRRAITSYLPPGGQAPYSCRLVDHTDAVTVDPTGQGLNVFTYYNHDEYGNVTDVFEHGGPTSSLDDRTTTTLYKPNAGPYIVGLPHQVVLSEGVSPANTVRRSAFYCYDSDNGTDNTPCAGTITRGQLTATKVVNPSGWYDTTNYGYDAFGNLDRTTDADNRATTITYDPKYHQYPETVCDALGQCTTTQWYPGQDLVKASTDIYGVRTDYIYDPLGRLKSKQRKGHATTTYQYLDWGTTSQQRIRVSTDDGTPDGIWSETLVDGLARPYKTRIEGADPGLESIQETVYADAGTLVAKQSHWRQPGAAPVFGTTTYDSSGQPTKITHPDGSTLQYAYGNDTDASWTTVTDEFDHTTQTFSDGYGRTIRTREQAGGSNADTLYVHNAADELESITDPAKNVTTMNWDIRGNLRSTIDPDRGSTSYEAYDRTGHPGRIVDGNGEWTRLNYDGLGRLWAKQYPSFRESKWYYNEPGHGKSVNRVTSITDTHALGCPFKTGLGGYITKEYFYDDYGRISATAHCEDGRTVRVEFTYDGMDRIDTITYPDKEKVTNTYNSAGQLESVSGYADKLVYNAAGQLTTLKLPNGVTQTFHNNQQREWLDKTEVKRAGATLFDTTYGHYPNGLLKSATSTTEQRTLGFDYDGANQLTSITGDHQQTIGYDATGNLSANSELGTYNYAPSGQGNGQGCGTPAASIRCPHAVKSIGTTVLQYNALGGLTTITGGGSAFPNLRTISWNKDNEPYSFKDAAGTETRMRYDENGQRVYRNRGGSVTLYLNPFVDLEYVAGQPSTKSTQYYYAGDVLLAKKTANGKKAWFHSDRLGSTRLTTDENGNPINHYDYRPYGSPLGNATPPTNADDRFAGHRSDPDNDLIYMGARYYSPQLGRFISPDPIIPGAYEPRATNLYAYANNNPTGYIDPSGLDPDIEIDKPHGGSHGGGQLGPGGIHNPIGGRMVDPPPPPPNTAGEFVSRSRSEQAGLLKAAGIVGMNPIVESNAELLIPQDEAEAQQFIEFTKTALYGVSVPFLGAASFGTAAGPGVIMPPSASVASSIHAGAARAQQFGAKWSVASLSKAIARHAGPNATSWKTATGKMIHENPITGRQVVVDVAGGYFRIFQPKTIGGKAGTYLNLLGRAPSPARFVKSGAVKTVPLQGDDLQEATHFLIRH